jgi:hypothetical protein
MAPFAGALAPANLIGGENDRLRSGAVMAVNLSMGF